MRLLFPLAGDDPDTLEHSSFPFLLISDSDPIARIVAARVDTGCGDRVASLFFLVQKDRYRLENESLHPATNVEVENAWRRAGTAFRALGEGVAPRSFGEPSGAGGSPVPFAPLFFCKEKRRYFHPPCPRCGRPLALCTDDAVLSAAGLPLYSGSIERTLFCEDCTKSPAGNFYSLEVKSGAPAVLRDRISLVREFGKVGDGSSSETGFPCPACTEREVCYGSSLKALGRIVPFSFYPFHAFAFDAMSLCASDFLALLSGAGAESLAKGLESAGESGRAALVRSAGKSSPLLFERGERRFLEILYLKLSLLAELLDSMPTGEMFAGPLGVRPSIDRVWVDFGAARNHLPRYWNFRASVLDVGRSAVAGEGANPGSPGRADLSFLGVSWFEALLVNGKQDGTVLGKALSDRLRNPSAETPSSFPGARDPGSPFFAGNLFFEPTADPLPDGVAELWDAALAAGWAILLAGTGKGPVPGRETIHEEIRALRGRIRERLFGDAAGSVDDADAAIPAILDAILRKWTAEAVVPEAPSAKEAKPGPVRPRPAAPAGDDFLVKTVVLGGRNAPPLPVGPPLIPTDAARTPREPERKRSVPPEETIEKTMILRAGNVPPMASASQDESIEKTMILRSGIPAPSPTRAEPPPPVPPSSADDFLDRTVILGPGKSGIVPPAPPKANEPEHPAAEEPVDLEKTVILKAPPDAGKFRRHGR